jgi:hypothetical protein
MNNNNHILQVSDIFLYVGAILSCLGLTALTYDRWDKYDYNTRVLLSLILGSLLLLAGLTKLTNHFSNIALAIGSILSIVGYYVLFEGIIDSNITITIIGLVEFGILQFLTRRNVFTLFNTQLAASLFIQLTDKYQISIIGHNNYSSVYETITKTLLGLGFVIISQYLRSNQKSFDNLFNYLGVFIILNIGYFNYTTNNVFIIGYGLELGFIVLLCLQNKNKPLLYLTMFYIIAYLFERIYTIFELNTELILVFAGLLVMAIGYIIFLSR